ncbi:MAG: DUF1700 domain-containing protein [Christensenellales bacterium]|jgi:uncharacterized membrane protein
MNKQDFLRDLDKYLRRMPQEDRAEILADYEEYFEAAKEKGDDEQTVCHRLGTPKTVAAEYRALLHVEAAEKKPRLLNVSRAVFSAAASEAMGILGIIPAYSAVVLTLVILYAGGIGLALGGLVGIAASVTYMGTLSNWLNFIAPHGAAGLFLAIAGLSGGILILMFAYWMGKRTLPSLLRLLRRFVGKKEERGSHV